MPPFAVAIFHYNPHGQLVLHAMPIMVAAVCVLAVAYRYYSAFLAAKVAVLNDSRVTPANRLNDGQNYHPTNKWVLFGHHFAAISGAGPLIGPVLAVQFGYLPGLLWLVVGVCLAGAVQDMLVLAASTRRDGKSLAEIARHELGKPAAVIASIAILFIVIIALAGLGIIVVKALGGEEAKLPAGMEIRLPSDGVAKSNSRDHTDTTFVWDFPPGCYIRYAPGQAESLRSEAFRVRVTAHNLRDPETSDRLKWRKVQIPEGTTVAILPSGCVQLVPGSSWGTFTIACTIPIALLVGLWMYRIRKGRVVEASLIGGALTLGAVVVGGFVPGSSLEPFFSLTKHQTIWALCIYGFLAAVLPVWLLLGPRDYLSSFLKIGTIVLLVVSVCVANPPLEAPKFNAVFMNGGPTFKAGGVFPFVFICVMCGAVSGFHSLVSSGTTPKMIEKESHIRTIGYGAMLIEGLVGITALIAASALTNTVYYDINVAIDDLPVYSEKVKEVEKLYGSDRLHATGVGDLGHLGQIEEKVGGESLRGRTGGAVTLAVGMSKVFEDAFRTVGVTADWLLKYWYHFAIMFEALFILTTIDAGTRIGRFLLQETVGRAYAPFGRPGWLPGALLASGLVTAGWGWLISSGSVDTIWPMFGIANQALAVLALALVTTWLVNTGRARYAFVSLLPMLWVSTTTLTAGYQLVTITFPKANAAGRMTDTALALNIGLVVFVLSSVFSLVLWAAARWLLVLRGAIPTRAEM